MYFQRIRFNVPQRKSGPTCLSASHWISHSRTYSVPSFIRIPKEISVPVAATTPCEIECTFCAYYPLRPKVYRLQLSSTEARSVPFTTITSWEQKCTVHTYYTLMWRVYHSYLFPTIVKSAPYRLSTPVIVSVPYALSNPQYASVPMHCSNPWGHKRTDTA